MLNSENVCTRVNRQKTSALIKYVSTHALFAVSVALLLQMSPASSALDDQHSSTDTMPLVQGTGVRRRDMDLNNTKDCLYDTRVNQRPFPGSCYSHKFDDWTNEYFNKFWSEIIGDFRYTFDFVLYDNNFPNAKYTQFWYIINYVKQLAVNVENPYDIVEATSTVRTLTTKIENMEREIQSLKDAIVQLKVNMKPDVETINVYNQNLTNVPNFSFIYNSNKRNLSFDGHN